MIEDTHLNTCISGSFKFKPEIDEGIEEFRDNGVTVLAPEEGWVLKPSNQILTVVVGDPRRRFRPLKGEIGMDIKAVEDIFLENVRRSDFLYVINPEGYLGYSTLMEIGFAAGLGIPVYFKYPPNPNLDSDPVWAEMCAKAEVKSIEEVIRLHREA